MRHLPITGYADRLIAAQGESIRFYVSTTEPSFEARVLRLAHLPEEHQPVKTDLDLQFPGKLQEITTGSYGQVEAGLGVLPDAEITLYIFPTGPGNGQTQGVLTWGPDVGLFLTGDGCLSVRWDECVLTVPQALLRNAWYSILLRIQVAAGELTLIIEPVGAGRVRTETSIVIPKSQPTVDSASFRLSGWLEQSVTLGCLDGKIARPRIFSPSSGVVAEWDCSSGFDSDQVRDISPFGRHIQLFNHPRRAVTGPDWSGRFLDFRLQPSEYDAIAFHRDDMTDAAWSESLSWTVPDDLQSDVYALEVSCPGGHDYIPFIVRPYPARTRNAIAFLVPTFSYLAYANEHHWWNLPDIEKHTGRPLEEILSPGEKWANEVGMLSCYDRHADGTGCVHSSWLRPIVNLRPDYVHPYAMGPHQLSADLYILDWLREQGYAFDVITDHDLHEQGADMLSPYRVLVSGSHPEYVSEQILEGISSYIKSGGNFMYVGGNGFYSVATVYPHASHVLELRRGHYGGLHWKSAVGEGYHAATGEPGGLWKGRGRAAQHTFGVGMAGVNFGLGKPYQRTAESFNPRYEWIFRGVSGDSINALGDVLGGAAGFEYDRMDSALGSPAETVLLASACFDPPQTEHSLNDSRWTGCEAPNRSDIVIIEREGIGSVFAAGSICWTSALFDKQGNNDVSRITKNILDRFSAPASCS